MEHQFERQLVDRMVAGAFDIGVDQSRGLYVGVGMSFSDFADRREDMAEAVVVGARCMGGERYWFGTSSTRRFWARPSLVLLVATKSVFP